MHVDFFIAGAPKSGTSALAQYLSDHPQICFAQPKETWFFSKDLYPIWQKAQNIADYHTRFFGHYDQGVHRVVGEGTPLYLFSQIAVPEILKYNPDARFLVMIRNPMEMAISLYSQLRYNGKEIGSGKEHENAGSFIEAWELQEDRAKGNMMTRNVVEPLVLQYGQVCMLGSQLKKLYTQVQKDRVHVVVFEDFNDNTKAEYVKVLDFLGVQDDGRAFFPRVNKRKAWKNNAAEKIFKSVIKFHEKLGIHLNLGILKGLRMQLTSPAETAKLPPPLIEKMRTFFRDDVGLLSELIERDLSHWLTT